FQDDLEIAKSAACKNSNMFKFTSMINAIPLKKNKTSVTGKSQEKQLSRVFSEDYETIHRKILDPRGATLTEWNKCFLLACLTSLFVDPLFFYLAEVREEMCMEASVPLEIALTAIRSIIDVFYIIQIYIRFHTAYVAPSSRAFGRGELVIDSSKISSRYLRKDFWLDILAALPLPQVFIWIAIPHLRGSTMISTKVVLRMIIISQFLLRLCLTSPLTTQITKANGVVAEAAWAGAAYNLMLFMLASHVIGSCWYFLAIEREEQCWKEVCDLHSPNCQYWFYDCRSINDPGRAAWFTSSNVSSLCGPNSDFYHYGIYIDAFTSGITSSNFLNKYFYCFWWGLRNLSSIGQNLSTSTYIGEINFSIIIAIVGLVLFGLLIGNMQTYLQSTTIHLEEWRIRRTDTEQWMHHRQLPRELRESVRRHDMYKWVTARGVDEEAILKGLPLDLRRDIKRHLCLDLVRRVPLFNQMDDLMLDAICERLKPVLCTRGTCLVREGDPVNEMLFIIRGNLDSYTTDGGRTGFLNFCSIGRGDFCGEELLTWALDPRPSVILPSSTRTVTAISEVEAFALVSHDLKFVASQFRKLHSKQLRHTFRFHSHQWRTWAACFIQAVWFRYRKRKVAAELKAKEAPKPSSPEPANKQACTPLSPLASDLAMYVATFAGSTKMRGSKRDGSEFDLSSLTKPVEPDFLVDER
ncbi:hypothetical protein RJ639_034506, partial [Escallonia herrerae]